MSGKCPPSRLESQAKTIRKLTARNNGLTHNNKVLKAERDAARRGILELYHLELITMSRARELMGLKHIDPVREMYRKLRPEFEKEHGDMGYATPDPAVSRD